MNIIQIQDRLKGVADNALIGYVQNPTGEVPTYLALTELNRRKEMRNNYQKEKEPNTSVAEDLTQEAQPQQGLGALQMPQQGLDALQMPQQGLGALQMPQQMPQQMPMEQMAQGGLVDLPVNDSMFQEQNYANGGIVAFNDGGEARYNAAVDARTTPTPRYAGWGYVAPQAIRAAKYGYKGLNWLKAKALGTPKVTLPTMNLPTGAVTPVLEAGTRGFLKMPGTYIDTAVVGGVLYGINQYGEKEEISAEKAKEIALAKAAKEKAAKELADKEAADKLAATPKTEVPAEEKIKSIGEYAKELEDYVGVDPNTALQRDRLAKMESRASTQEERAPWMALAQAGFGMAAGQSPFAMQNIAEGAGMGIKSYATAQDKIADLEEKRNALALGLDQAQRSERIAFAQFGANSKQAEEARQHTTQIADKKIMADIIAANIKSQRDVELAGILKPSEQGAIADKVINSEEFEEWQANWFEKNGDKYSKESAEFKNAYQNELNRLVAQRVGRSPGYPGFSVVK